jgi:hypothetical protein
MTQFTRRRELEIDKEAIWGDDAFGTLEGYATFLTNALVADPGNFVLNVNGAWGTGKSFFVQRWAEQLRQAGHPVVEFNAWENDSVEDPLAPLIATLIDSQKKVLPPTVGDKLKHGCGKYIMAGGGLIVRAGLKQLVGEKGIDSVNEMLSSDSENELIELAGKHVDEQLEKQKAAKSIVGQLKAFVTAIEAHKDMKLPIFIFIDELDRCRPTFAIELLERVKHLFGVDGIKFVISTDSTQLVHSIQGVYGANFDSYSYLRRFFDETFTLPNPSAIQFARSCLSSLEHKNWVNNFADGYLLPDQVFGGLSSAFALTLRDQEQVFHRMSAILANIPNEQPVLLIPLCFLTILRMKDPDRFRQLIRTSDKYTNWQKVEVKLLFSEEQIRIQLDAYFKYTAMDHESARKSYKGPITSQDRREKTDKELDEIHSHGLVLGNFNSFKNYSALIELTSTLS